MDKKKIPRINGNKKARTGLPLNIHDKNGNPLHTGDKIRWGKYEGILLWNQPDKRYWFMILNSQWYGENPYDAESYGKGFRLCMDNGARMEMELLPA